MSRCRPVYAADGSLVAAIEAFRAFLEAQPVDPAREARYLAGQERIRERRERLGL